MKNDCGGTDYPSYIRESVVIEVLLVTSHFEPLPEIQVEMMYESIRATLAPPNLTPIEPFSATLVVLIIGFSNLCRKALKK
jgi:hypothetical protein